jgi:hypothetical protein
MTPMQSDESNVTDQRLSAMTQLAELLRQASVAGQNASRALAQMRRAYLPAGSFQETDPETLRQGQNTSATSSRNTATSHPSSDERSAGD